MSNLYDPAPLRFSNDMTIDQRQFMWPASRSGVTKINNHKDKRKESNDVETNT